MSTINHKEKTLIIQYGDVRMAIPKNYLAMYVRIRKNSTLLNGLKYWVLISMHLMKDLGERNRDYCYTR